MAGIIPYLRSVSVYHVAIALLILAALAGILYLPSSAQPSAAIIILTAVIAALASQAVLDLLIGRKAAFSEAAVISGLIIGSILPPGSGMLLAIPVPFVAMLFKHFLRVKNIPLFNPAGLGLLIANVALGTHMAWWAGAPFPLSSAILTAAIIIISWKLRKLPLQAAFLIAWLLLWAIVGAFHAESLLGTIPLFLMAFMLIEHTTSPMKLPHQLLYGFAVAIIGFAIAQTSLQLDAMLIALLAGNALTKILGALG